MLYLIRITGRLTFIRYFEFPLLKMAEIKYCQYGVEHQPAINFQFRHQADFFWFKFITFRTLCPLFVVRASIGTPRLNFEKGVTLYII